MTKRYIPKPVDDSNCTNWTGYIDRQGYGNLPFNRKLGRRAAHRAAYEQAYGPIPPGMFILHHCDNRRCVKPEHLYAGTNADNMRDKRLRGRSAQLGKVGSLHPKARLNENDVLQIKQMLADGLTQVSIAKKFGCTHSNISSIALIRR